jgi:hypothetical protein
MRYSYITMRIRDNDERVRLYEQLTEATGESSKSQALDAAARYYLRMHGDVAGWNSQVKALLELADKQGTVTAREIAEQLDTREYSVKYRTEIDA